MDIAAPVTQGTFRKRFLWQGEHGLRTWESEIRLSPAVPLFLSANLGQALYAALNGGDILVLGNDKADQRFPWILTQDTDAFFMLGSSPKKRIGFRVDPCPDGAVILLQVKISLPAILNKQVRKLKVINLQIVH